MGRPKLHGKKSDAERSAQKRQNREDDLGKETWLAGEAKRKREAEHKVLINDAM